MHEVKFSNIFLADCYSVPFTESCGTKWLLLPFIISCSPAIGKMQCQGIEAVAAEINNDDDIIEIVDTEQTDMPLPSNILTMFLGGLFILAFLAAMYAARAIVLPIVLAFMLKLLLQPIMRFFEKLHVPRALAAFCIILAVFGSIVGLGAALSGPAEHWAAKLPQGVPRLEERLSFFSTSITALQQFLHQADSYTQLVPATEETVVAPPQGPSLITTITESLFTSTRSFVSGFFTTILVLFFLLVSGDTFLRRLVEILPRFKDKRQAVDISQQIENDISVYLLTITIMNSVVGILTGLIMWFCGLGDPVLWGAVAFLLNYVPFLGPLVGIGIFLMAGLLSIDSLGQALLPVGLYLVLHLVEGQAVTPMLLAKRLTLNPVLIIISLIFWYWMWGVPGAVLAVPMLVIVKITCDRIRKLAALGHFLEA